MIYYFDIARKLNTAILTATPFSTWSNIAEFALSATTEESSTPLLIGPGCITITSLLAFCITAGVSPKSFEYSLSDGIRSFAI